MNKSNKKQPDHENEPAMIGIIGDGTQPPTHDIIKLRQWYVQKSFEIIENSYRVGFHHGYCLGLKESDNEKELNDWYYLTLNENIPFMANKGFADCQHVQMKFRKGFCQGFRLALKNANLEEEIRDWRYSDYTKIIIPPGHEFAGHVWGVKN